MADFDYIAYNGLYLTNNIDESLVKKYMKLPNDIILFYKNDKIITDICIIKKGALNNIENKWKNKKFNLQELLNDILDISMKINIDIFNERKSFDRMHIFPCVKSYNSFSIVITSCLVKYTRMLYLKKNIYILRQHFPNIEIIVVFDKKGCDKLWGVDKIINHNNGLGYSLNIGSDVASNDVILFTEDDFIINRKIKNISEEFINKAISMTDNAIVRLYYDMINRNYSFNIDETFIKVNKLIGTNFEYFSNNPHIRNKKFSIDVGKFPENAPPPVVELSMVEKFSKSKYDVYLYPNLFEHIGSNSIRDYPNKINTSNILYYQTIIPLGNVSLCSHIIEEIYGEQIFYPFNECDVNLDYVIYNITNNFVPLTNMVLDKRNTDHYLDGHFVTDARFKYSNFNIEDNIIIYLNGIDMFMNSLNIENIVFVLCYDLHNTYNIDEINKLNLTLKNNSCNDYCFLIINFVNSNNNYIIDNNTHIINLCFINDYRSTFHKNINTIQKIIDNIMNNIVENIIF